MQIESKYLNKKKWLEILQVRSFLWQADHEAVQRRWNHFKAVSLTLKYKYQGIQMKKTFPSFDLGIDHLFHSDPEERNQKKEEQQRCACIDVTSQPRRGSSSEDNKICDKMCSKRFSR